MSLLDRKIREATALLEATYPVFAECRPLAIGTLDRLAERHPEIEPKVLRNALLGHCRRPGYLKALAEATERYDLDGNPAEPVTDEHREHARKTREETLARIKAEKKRKLETAKAARLAAERKKEKLSRMEAALKAKEAAKTPPKPAQPPAPKPGRPVLTLKKPPNAAKGQP